MPGCDIHSNVSVANLKKIPQSRILLGAAVIAAATFLVYMPAIRGGFIWDDPQYVVENATLRDLDGLKEMWTNPTSLPQWYPLVHTTFWIEYHLWELAPLGYHVNNVLLHITAALLLWRVLHALEVPGAWLAAAIFALHPVEVESVAWITERKNVLSAVFYLLSLLAYLRFLESRRWGIYALALPFFVAALLSKSVVATFPCVMLVLIWWKRGKIAWQDVTPLIPFFVLGVAMGLFTAHLEAVHVGASGERIAELNLEPLDRVLIAGRAVWFYAMKIVFPWPLVFIYPQWRGIDWRVGWQWIYPIGVVLVILLLLLSRRRLGRGPAAAAMIFCGTLFPALGFVNVYPMRFSYVADHFQYHASAALIALIAAILCKYAGRYGRAVLIPLAALTFMQTPTYKDEETLWRATLAWNPNSWMVHTNLGHLLRAGGKQVEAEEEYRLAFEADPDIHETNTNFGMALLRRGANEQALAHFRKALEINPNFVPARYGIGRVYLNQGNLDDAARNFREALQRAEGHPGANFYLGIVLQKQGKLAEAASYLRNAVAGMPNDFDARYTLGSVALRLGEYIEAVYNLREAVRINPGAAGAWFLLADAEDRAGHPENGTRFRQRALQIDPGLKSPKMQ